LIGELVFIGGGWLFSFWVVGADVQPIIAGTSNKTTTAIRLLVIPEDRITGLQNYTPAKKVTTQLSLTGLVIL
jgi:hypothetical protein